VGLVAAVLMPGLSDATLVLPSMIKEVLPVGLRGMVVAGVIAVVMSSADSFLNAASIALVNDVIQPLRRDGLDDASRLLLARAATLITGALAVFFAIRIASVLDILIYAYHFWAPVILVPLAATLMGWRSNKRAFAGGAAAGLAGVFLWRYAPGEAGEIDGLVVGVFANLLTFALICFVTIRARADAPGPAAE
jgi:SSS family solute:Na+ symporter